MMLLLALLLYGYTNPITAEVEQSYSMTWIVMEMRPALISARVYSLGINLVGMRDVWVSGVNVSNLVVHSNIHVLLKIYMYCSKYTCTAQNIHVPLKIYMYRSKYTCTAQNIHVPLKVYMYRSKYTCTPRNIHVLLEIYLYRSKYTCTAQNIHVLLKMLQGNAYLLE